MLKYAIFVLAYTIFTVLYFCCILCHEYFIPRMSDTTKRLCVSIAVLVTADITLHKILYRLASLWHRIMVAAAKSMKWTRGIRVLRLRWNLSWIIRRSYTNVSCRSTTIRYASELTASSKFARRRNVFRSCFLHAN